MATTRIDLIGAAAESRRIQWLTQTWAAVLLVGILLIPSAYILASAPDMPAFGDMHDDGLYMVGGKALAEGAGHKVISLPDPPYQTKYPPLFPALLSLVWRINPHFPDNLFLAGCMVFAFLPVLLILARCAFEDFGYGPRAAWAMCAILAINPYTLAYSHALMAEIPLACGLLGALILAHRVERGEAGCWSALAAGTVAGITFLVKVAALPLLAVALVLALRKRYLAAALFLAGMLPAIVGWMAWAGAHRAASSDFTTAYYTDYLRYHIGTLTWRHVPMLLTDNLRLLVPAAGALILPLMGKSTTIVIVWGYLGLIAVIGTWMWWRRRGMDVYLGVFGAWIGMLMVLTIVPKDRFERLLFPVLTILIGMMAPPLIVIGRIAWHNASRPVGPARGAAGALVLAALTCIATPAIGRTISWVLDSPSQAAERRRQLAKELPAYRWAMERTGPDTAFLAANDPVFYLYSGRRAFRAPILNRATMPRELDGKPAAALLEGPREKYLKYVFASREDDADWLVEQRIIAPSDRGRPAFQGDKVALYQVRLAASDRIAQ